jgi:hypothetical protein
LASNARFFASILHANSCNCPAPYNFIKRPGARGRTLADNVCAVVSGEARRRCEMANYVAAMPRCQPARPATENKSSLRSGPNRRRTLLCHAERNSKIRRVFFSNVEAPYGGQRWRRRIGSWKRVPRRTSRCCRVPSGG